MTSRMCTRSRVCLGAAVSALFLASSSPCASAYSGVIAFGDSLSDRGNTFEEMGYGWFIQNFTGYSATYYYSAYNSYDIPAHGRFANGPTWVEYLEGNLRFNTMGSAPVDLGANPGTNTSARNFAWGASTTGTGYKDLGPSGVAGQVANLQTQVADYVSMMNNGILPTPSNALITLWSGANDAIYWVKGGNRTTEGMQATAAAAASNVAAALSILYDAGSRHFLVPNLPALGEKPDFRSDPDKRFWGNAFSSYFNLALGGSLAALHAPEARIYEFDIHTLFNDLLANPTDYGLSNSSDPAWRWGFISDTIVDNPGDYLFWDSNIHPTTQAHQIIGDRAYLLVVPEPGTITLLLASAGLAVLLRLRIRRPSATRQASAQPSQSGFLP